MAAVELTILIGRRSFLSSSRLAERDRNMRLNRDFTRSSWNLSVCVLIDDYLSIDVSRREVDRLQFGNEQLIAKTIAEFIRTEFTLADTIDILLLPKSLHDDRYVTAGSVTNVVAMMRVRLISDFFVETA